MPNFLLIESSGEVCSAAVAQGSKLIAEKSIQEMNSHSTYMASYVEDVMHQSGLDIVDLDAIVVGAGPGSYTGLRIGTSLAKGMCFGARIPLIACSTLKALAASMFAEYPNLERVVSLIDARRMDAYLGVFNAKLEPIIDEQFVTIDAQLAVDYAGQNTGAKGNGVQKWQDEFDVGDVVTSSNTGVYARDMLPEALSKWQAKDFVDVAYYEPNYIKSVFVTKPKPKF